MQNKSNQMIEYKQNIFFQIKDFFKRLFFRNKKYQVESENVEINQQEIIVLKSNNDFKDSIAFEENAEKQRISNLKMKYDKGELSKEELTIEDMDSLIKLYNDETENLNMDTENRKCNIQKMLNELKMQKA